MIPLLLIRLGSGASTAPQVGKAVIGDVGMGAAVGDVGMGAAIGDAGAGTATIGDDP